MTRLHRSLIALVCAVVLFGACSDDKKPSAQSASGSSQRSGAASASASGAASSSGEAGAAGASTTTMWPLTASPTTIAPKGSKNSDNSQGSPSGGAPSNEVCNRLAGQQLQDALGVAFSSASGDSASCTYNGDDGSRVTLSVSAVEGDAAQTVQRQEGRCDPGTVHPINVADGGYTCRLSGQPAGGIATNGQFLRLVLTIAGSIDPNKGEDGFAQLLGELA